MSAGDFVVRRNASNTDEVVDAGSDLLLLWDTAVSSTGSGITYSAGTFTLGETGHFLVMASDQWGTTDTSGARNNAKLTLNLGGTELQEGYSTGYVRRSTGSQEFINFSAAIINVTSTTGTADDLQVRLERVDSATAGTVNRIADRSGVTIIKLDDTSAFGRYESSAAFTPSATAHTYNTADIGSTLEEDSPFTRTGNVVDIATNNLVLAVYSFKNDTSDTISGRTEMQGCLELGGTVVPGSYSQTYGPRATGGCDLGGMSGMCLLEPTSGDDLELQLVSREDADEDWFGSLQLVELPSGTEAIIVEATTGDFNASATNFAWDTNPYIDTAAFTHTTGNANLDVDNADDYIAIASMAQTSAWNEYRNVPAIGFRVNSTDTNVSGSSSYNRDGGNAEYAAVNCGALLAGLSANDNVYARADRLGTQSGTAVCGSGAMSLIRLSTLFSSAPDDLLADDIESDSELTTPAVGQEHELSSTSVETTSELTTPVVGQEHILSSTSVETTSELSTPTISQVSILLADDIETTSEITTPVVGQVHAVTANDVESNSEVTTPLVGQVHVVTADDVESSSELTSPDLGQSYALLADDVETSTEVTLPAISETSVLLADDIESSSEVTNPTLISNHALLATSIESTSELTTPAVSQLYNLLADDIESISEITNPTIGQLYALVSEDIESLSEVSIPTLGMNHNLAGDSVESNSHVSSPTLLQVDYLLAEGIESLSEITNPTLGQVHNVYATSVEVSSELSVPDITHLKDAFIVGAGVMMLGYEGQYIGEGAYSIVLHGSDKSYVLDKVG